MTSIPARFVCGLSEAVNGVFREGATLSGRVVRLFPFSEETALRPARPLPSYRFIDRFMRRSSLEITAGLRPKSVRRRPQTRNIGTRSFAAHFLRAGEGPRACRLRCFKSGFNESSIFGRLMRAASWKTESPACFRAKGESPVLVTSRDRILSVGCSAVQFALNLDLCNLHSTAYLCTALKIRAGFNSPHPLQPSSPTAYVDFPSATSQRGI